MVSSAGQDARLNGRLEARRYRKTMKVRLATVWFGGCSGCHMSFLDLDEFLVDLVEQVEIVYSPVVDVKEYPENVDVCLIEGAICNEDNLELLHKVRQRTKVLVSFGDCAVTANVPAIRNQLGLGNSESVLQRAYVENAQFNQRVPSAGDGIVPTLLDRVLPVHEVVHVEYFLPGCPPPAERIKAVVSQLLSGVEPKLEGTQLKFG
jgi:NAD-reducing hydrogenase small subunit